MVCGVFLGSALWWLLLSGAVGFFRRALTPERLRWVNRLSGAAAGRVRRALAPQPRAMSDLESAESRSRSAIAYVPPTAVISPSCGMAGALVMKSTTPSWGALISARVSP